ncbi:hypothetical protein WL78_26570 [Burkholderia ubonensis]|uniref:DUF7716 domain-containing protein n=1 Tax=Burkholderia ubonensis TaxID=101571 RepID=UPI0007566E60|nr:hypothetical protein [Burkholderia ubonensis]KWE62664.1 hypothetical protein WL78_26570 [Burkholderia ubonensis]OJA31566.1 hypothetical protein BGX87_14830 [Burkholderia ubonensis]
MLTSASPATEVSLKRILEQPGDFSGWLYLPPTPWTLDTVGAFAPDTTDPDEDTVPDIAKQPGWRITLDSATIESVVINAHEQVDDPGILQLFDAFVYYVENDAFILL